ncbi:hypothetical protein HK096_009616, partial [Nowakowskiella sp. JEL0078]
MRSQLHLRSTYHNDDAITSIYDDDYAEGDLVRFDDDYTDVYNSVGLSTSLKAGDTNNSATDNFYEPVSVGRDALSRNSSSTTKDITSNVTSSPTGYRYAVKKEPKNESENTVLRNSQNEVVEENLGILDPDKRDLGKIFVGALNWDTTDESLHNYFGQFGEVLDCVVMKDQNTGRSRGFGFLTFKDSNVVDKVVSRSHNLDGKVIDPKRAIPREEQEKTEKIFVGGLGHDVTEDSFRQYFEQFGAVIDATLMIGRDTGKPRGFGFITFETYNGVEKVLSAQSQGPLQINGKVVEVRRAMPKSKQQNNNGSQQMIGVGVNMMGGIPIGMMNNGMNFGMGGMGIINPLMMNPVMTAANNYFDNGTFVNNGYPMIAAGTQRNMIVNGKISQNRHPVNHNHPYRRTTRTTDQNSQEGSRAVPIRIGPKIPYRSPARTDSNIYPTIDQTGSSGINTPPPATPTSPETPTNDWMFQKRYPPNQSRPRFANSPIYERSPVFVSPDRSGMGSGNFVSYGMDSQINTGPRFVNWMDNQVINNTDFQNGYSGNLEDSNLYQMPIQ